MEKISNQTFNIKLTVVTPTFVGAGGDKDWKSGIDYIQKDGKIYVFDIEKMVALHLFSVNQLAELLVKGGRKVADVLSPKMESDFGNLERALRYLPFDSPIDKETKTDIRSYEVKSFIRSQFHDAPLIPGSSLKGAVRSILFKYLRTGNDKEVDVFGNFRKGQDFMRFIQVGDTELAFLDRTGSTTVVLNTKVFNLDNKDRPWHGGWKHRGGKNGFTDDNFKPEDFNTLYECAAPGASGSLVITLKKNAITLLPDTPKTPLLYKDAKKDILSDITKLFEIVNEHTREYLRKELEFFKEYRTAARTEEIIANIEDLIHRIPSDNSSCLLKMAAGSGFHSITGDWKYKDYYADPGYWPKKDKNGNVIQGEPGKKKYKSRKIVEYNDKLSLMGFVELKVEK